MSAGTGVIHSEVNPSQDEPVNFLQLWFLPEENGLKHPGARNGMFHFYFCAVFPLHGSVNCPCSTKREDPVRTSGQFNDGESEGKTSPFLAEHWVTKENKK